MGKIILLFNLFLFFKIMQRLVELNEFACRNGRLPGCGWFFWGCKVSNPVERVSQKIYMWFSWFFLCLLFVFLLFDRIDLDDVDKMRMARGSIGIFAFLVWRAMPYVKSVRSHIKG